MTSTDDLLRRALGAVAQEVRPDPHAYRRHSSGWRRRYRRRRAALAALATVVFAAADAVGLWALSRSDPHTHVIFSDTRPAQDPPIRIGQP